MQGKTIKQLETIIRDARLELSRRITVDDPFKAIKGQEHCKRALIVAAVQGHTVGIYGPHGSGKSMLVDAGRAIGVVVIEGTPCPCGNFMDARLPCKCTPAVISRHQQKLSKTAGKCDLHVECPSVPSRELLSKFHGTTIKHARDQLARIVSLPDKATRGSDCDEIIRQVVSELGMSAKTLDVCLSVAQSTAALCGRDSIQAEDVLEAVHYRPLDKLQW